MLTQIESFKSKTLNISKVLLLIKFFLFFLKIEAIVQTIYVAIVDSILVYYIKDSNFDSQ